MRSTNCVLPRMLLAAMLAWPVCLAAAVEDRAAGQVERGPAIKAFLQALPADAQVVVAVQDLENLDFDFMHLTRALRSPLGVLPSGLVQYLLGSSEQVDLAGVHGFVVLDEYRFKDAVSFQWLGDQAALLLAISAKDPTKLLEALGAERAEAKDYWTFRLQEQQVFATIREKVVLVGPDLKVLREVTQPVRERAPAGMQADLAAVEACADSDVWMLGSVRQMLAANRGVLRSLCTMGIAMARGQSDAPKTTGVCDAAFASLYVEMLMMQVNDLAVTVDISRQGVRMSYVVTYPPGSVLGQAWEAGESMNLRSLAGLPAGKFIFAGWMGKRAVAAMQTVADLAMPLWGMMAGALDIDHKEWPASGPAWLGSARQILEQFECAGLACYTQPEGAKGLLAVVGTVGCKDVDKALSMIRHYAGRDRKGDDAPSEDAGGKKGSGLRYVADAEEVESVPVDHVRFGETPAPAASEAACDEDHVLRVLLGEPSFLVRLARKEGLIVAGVEGEPKMLARALSLKAGEGSLADDPRIVSAGDGMPTRRAVEGYLATDTFAAFVARSVTEAMKLGGQAVPGAWSEHKSDNLIWLAVSGDSAATRADLYMPTQEIQTLRDLGMWGVGYATQRVVQKQGIRMPNGPAEVKDEKGSAAPF